MDTVRAPFLSLLTVLLLATPCSVPAAAQESDREDDRAPSELFVETVDVDVVNVEVVVTDRSGEPVRGLTRGDFVVREDGEPVELTNFYAVEGGRRALSEEEPGATGPGAPAPGAEPLPPLPDDQKLNLVVLIDNLNITPTSRNRILRELDTRLDEVLRPGDRVLVAASNPELRVRQTFTDDHAAVTAALDRLERTVSRGALLDADTRQIRRTIAEAAGAIAASNGQSCRAAGGRTPVDCARLTLDMIRSWAAETHTTNLRLLGTLERFVEALAGVPGRRAVLLVSEGFPVQPGGVLMEEWWQVFAQWARAVGVLSPESEAARRDARSELIALTEVAAGNHVAFYSLESGSVFHDGLSAEGRHASAPSRMGEITSRAPLTDLAWRTGGVSLMDSGNVEVLLDRMAADYREYYSLGYRSAHSNDGEYHRIEVEVPGRRVRVRHTEGFRAATPEQRTVERTMSALVFNLADNPMSVRVEVGEAQEERRGLYLLPVLVRVPIASLTLIPREATHQGKVSVVVAVRSEEGALSEPTLLEVPVEIPNDRLLQAVGLQVGKGVNLLVRKGESKLAVGVRDELSGTVSTLNLSLSVGGG